jgi:hypothetical protein
MAGAAGGGTAARCGGTAGGLGCAGGAACCLAVGMAAAGGFAVTMAGAVAGAGVAAGAGAGAGGGAGAATAGRGVLGAAAAGAGFGKVALTAVLQLGDSVATFFCRHCSASAPPGRTLEHFDMKSERQDDLMADCCSGVICAAAPWGSASATKPTKSAELNTFLLSMSAISHPLVWLFRPL